MKKNLIMFTAGVLSLLFFSCAADDESGTVSFDQTTFNSEQSAWTAENLQNYSFTYTADRGDAYGPEKLTGTVTVTDGVGTVSFSENSSLPEEGSIYYLTSIDAVFKLITQFYQEDVANSGSHSFKTATYTIAYDDTLHYPTYVTESYTSSDDGLSGFSITISDFSQTGSA
jgi:hypothetical protein